MPVYNCINGVLRDAEPIIAGTASIVRPMAKGYCGIDGVVRQFYQKHGKIVNVTLGDAYRVAYADYDSSTASFINSVTEDVKFSDGGGLTSTSYARSFFNGRVTVYFINSGYMYLYCASNTRVYFYFELCAVFEDGFKVDFSKYFYNSGMSFSIPVRIQMTRKSDSGSVGYGYNFYMFGNSVLPTSITSMLSGVTYDTSSSGPVSSENVYDVYFWAQDRGGTQWPSTGTSSYSVREVMIFSTATIDGVSYPVNLFSVFN